MIERPQDQMHLQGIDPLLGKTLIVRKRDGRHVDFNEARILLAIESAFKAVEGISLDAELPPALQVAVKKCADVVTERVLSRAVRGEQMEVERIQDAVEDQLMLEGHLAVARCYILYREKRRLARAEREGRLAGGPLPLPLPPEIPFPFATVPVQPAPKPLRLLESIYCQALQKSASGDELVQWHRARFSQYVHECQYLNLLAPELLEFDLEKLAAALRPERDAAFSADALQHLHDECLLRDQGRCVETPQYFWMRLAMGLALNEGEQATVRALEFYEVLSTFRFVPSEHALRRAGTVNPQLIACYGATSWADLEHISALPVKTGSTCSWLEPWHTGIFDFLARPKPGAPPWDHDLNKALWIPDLFMKRFRQHGRWTLFDPAEAPALHQTYGRAFEKLYLECEEKAAVGEISGARQIDAAELWEEIMASLLQTGQPWLGFKDAANVRSPTEQKVVRSGSLCASILLNTGPHEAAACSLGSINLAAHLTGAAGGGLDAELLRDTVSAAMRMLDNVLDISGYMSDSARAFSHEHRPAGLGVCGFQEAIDRLGISYGSAAAAQFADRGMELISYHAILASAALAKERGPYPSFADSKWNRGLMPMDTLPALSAERGLPVDFDRSTIQDWRGARDTVLRQGLRHCATTAIAPNEFGAKIIGVFPSIEPDPANPPPAPWLIECAARRQKWLDMGQSLALYATAANASELSEIYLQAWEKGLKTVRQLHRKKTATRQAHPDAIQGGQEKLVHS